jgi:hypothetical protein
MAILKNIVGLCILIVEYMIHKRALSSVGFKIALITYKRKEVERHGKGYGNAGT